MSPRMQPFLRGSDTVQSSRTNQRNRAAFTENLERLLCDRMLCHLQIKKGKAVKYTSMRDIRRHIKEYSVVGRPPIGNTGVYGVYGALEGLEINGQTCAAVCKADDNRMADMIESVLVALQAITLEAKQKYRPLRNKRLQFELHCYDAGKPGAFDAPCFEGVVDNDYISFGKSIGACKEGSNIIATMENDIMIMRGDPLPFFKIFNDTPEVVAQFIATVHEDDAREPASDSSSDDDQHDYPYPYACGVTMRFLAIPIPLASSVAKVKYAI